MDQKYQHIRCPHCGRLLGKGYINSGEVEFKCPRCNRYYTLRAMRPDAEPCNGHEEKTHAHGFQH